MAEIGATVEIDAQLLRAWPLPRPGGAADKEERGATLVIAGSAEMPGTAALAATSALRAGAGKIAVAAVFACQHVEEAAQAQDHVAPALAAGRTEIELAHVQALLGEVRVLGADAERRQPVEDAELLLAQALVANAGDRLVVARRVVAVQRVEDAVGGLARATTTRSPAFATSACARRSSASSTG